MSGQLISVLIFIFINKQLTIFPLQRNTNAVFQIIYSPLIFDICGQCSWDMYNIKLEVATTISNARGRLRGMKVSLKRGLSFHIMLQQFHQETIKKNFSMFLTFISELLIHLSRELSVFLCSVSEADYIYIRRGDCMYVCGSKYSYVFVLRFSLYGTRLNRVFFPKFIK